MTDEQRYAAYMALHTLNLARGGKFKRNDKKDVAQIFQVGVQHIRKIWTIAERQKALGQEVDVSNGRKGRCGRKGKDDTLSQIPTVPLNRRSTLRSLARQLGVSHTTLYKKLKLPKIRRHSNRLKPSLKEKNRRERIKFCLSMLDETTLAAPRPKFISMHNIVHIDEKWFYMTKMNRCYYLLPEEDDPVRTVRNKNCIGKVMFLTAVARPRYDAEGNMTFSGKIGIWPFVQEIPAARRSEYRARGTIEIKSINVNRRVMRRYMIEKVVPGIREVWPADDTNPILIQQDNARTHILPGDAEFAEAVATTGLDIKIINQPPNSPDLNALDLGYFRSLESLTDCRAPTTIKELIQGVQEEFDEYDAGKLNRIFLTLQTIMVEVMNHGGENSYKIPHLRKERLESQGILPPRIRFPREVYENAMEILEQDIME